MLMETNDTPYRHEPTNTKQVFSYSSLNLSKARAVLLKITIVIVYLDFSLLISFETYKYVNAFVMLKK